MLVFEDIFQVFTCITKQIAIAGIWNFKLKVYGDLSISHVSVISLSFLLVMLFQNSLHTVFPSVTPPVVSLPTTFSRGMGQLALRYRQQLPPCF